MRNRSTSSESPRYTVISLEENCIIGKCVRATPTPPDSEGLDFLGKTLVGWEEIRDSLSFVEKLRKQGIQNHARIEVYEYSENSRLKVTFRTVAELDSYLQSRFRIMLLAGVGDSLKIDDIQRVSDEVYARFNEMNDVHGQVVLN